MRFFSPLHQLSAVRRRANGTNCASPWRSDSLLCRSSGPWRSRSSPLEPDSSPEPSGCESVERELCVERGDIEPVEARDLSTISRRPTPHCAIR
jgi:hypothetical protein